MSAGRWEIERALRTSGLPPPTRQVIQALLSHTDADADAASPGVAVVPLEFAPSLTRLAAETGLHRSTVARHEVIAEKAGWITRHRSPKAAREKIPNWYEVHEPTSRTARLVAQRDQGASRRERHELVAQRDPSSTSPEHNHPRGRGPAEIIRAVYPDATDDEIKIITEERASRGARSAEAVLAHEARQGTLRLPCDRDGPGRHSGACRDGDGGACVTGWCACRCHTKAVPR